MNELSPEKQFSTKTIEVEDSGLICCMHSLSVNKSNAGVWSRLVVPIATAMSGAHVCQ